MGFIKRKFNDMNLQTKLILSFVIAVIIPVIIVGFFLTQALRNMAVDDAVKQSSAEVERVKQRTSDVLEVSIYVSNNLVLDQHLMQLVNRNYESIIDVVKAYNSYDEFRKYLHTYNEIANIRFYMANDTMLNNWEFIPVNNHINNSFWYRRAKATKGLIGWYYINDETKHDNAFLSLVRRIDFPDYHTNGILVINVNTNYLNTILSQERFPTMIVDNYNHIVAANRKGLLGKKLEDIIHSEKAIRQDTGEFKGTAYGMPSQIIVDNLLPDISVNELRFVSVISNESIMKDANRLSILGISVVTISIFVALLLVYYFSRLISKRLVLLSRQINHVAQGNLEVPPIIDGKDEIGQLSKQLNDMVVSIKNLIAEVQQTNMEKNILEKRQNEIKLKMMASQINPHFLFNALESIRMKAHLKGEYDISQVVKQLGKLMRKSIEVGGGQVRIKSEIEMVKSYLEIQKFRYENRLNYQLNIDPETENLYIHPLIIQPLVENAVIHGLEDKEQGGIVVIETVLAGDNLIVKVIDDGVGISAEKMEQIKWTLKSMDEAEENRIGLRNVHQRLVITFGEASGLQIESELGKGTKIHFTIPIRGEGNV